MAKEVIWGGDYVTSLTWSVGVKASLGPILGNGHQAAAIELRRIQAVATYQLLLLATGLKARICTQSAILGLVLSASYWYQVHSRARIYTQSAILGLVPDTGCWY